MQPGQILVADQQGVYVIKMIGDVRLTLCISFDRFIEKMLGQPDFSMVLFDLSQASGIDSTTLGLAFALSEWRLCGLCAYSQALPGLLFGGCFRARRIFCVCNHLAEASGQPHGAGRRAVR